jgi:hypothetical protein
VRDLLFSGKVYGRLTMLSFQARYERLIRYIIASIKIRARYLIPDTINNKLRGMIERLVGNEESLGATKVFL